MDRGIQVRWTHPHGLGLLDGVILRIDEFREALWKVSPESPLRDRIQQRIRQDRRKLARLLMSDPCA